MTATPTVGLETVVRLWLERQGLAAPRGSAPATKRNLTRHLRQTGGLQLDSVNVLDRAHYLTLWSRFGPYDRKRIDRWCYRDRVAYEYWGHEASLLPISHLPIGRRRMRGFPPDSWKRAAWWPKFNVPASSKRRVMSRLRKEGPLESADFERRSKGDSTKATVGSMPLRKMDNRALHLLWHEGRIAIDSRTQFRRSYDLAERIYPEGPTASLSEYHDSWLRIGLQGNGIATEAHLVNYVTGPKLGAAERKRVIERNLKKKQIVRVHVDGLRDTFYAEPKALAQAAKAQPATGTHLLCPFDSLLWQRSRAEQLLGFSYRIEIYTPQAKRQYGYYVLPILHEGRFVGRLDPKLHRDKGELEIKAVHLEPGFKPNPHFNRGLSDALTSLAEFVDAERTITPKAWRRKLAL